MRDKGHGEKRKEKVDKVHQREAVQDVTVDPLNKSPSSTATRRFTRGAEKVKTEEVEPRVIAML